MIGVDDRASRHTLRARERHDWSLMAPEALDNSDRHFWGRDHRTLTLVQPTGSQTLTESYGKLAVSAIDSIAAEDLACRLWPATLATGQKWRCKVRVANGAQTFLMAAVVMTDGTLTSSNAVTALVFANNGVAQAFFTGRHGTLTALSTAPGGEGVITSLSTTDFVVILELEYTSANTFASRVFGYGDYGRYFQLLAITGTSKTMTPTHIGVGWTNWGVAPTTPEITFGPVYRAA